MTPPIMTSPFFAASRRDYLWITVGIVVAALESLGDPVATILVGRIFKELQQVISGHLLPHKFLHSLRIYCFSLVAVAGYTLILNWVGYMTWVSIGYRQGHRARRKLYRGLTARSAAWFDCRKQTNSFAATYFKDIQDIEAATGITAYEISSMATGFCLQIGVAFYFSWAVTLVCLLGIPVLALIGSLVSPKITQRIGISKSLLDQISERVTWVLNSLQTVKIFQRERYEWVNLHRKLKQYQKLTINYWVLFKLQEGLCRAIVLMIFVQGFYFGSFMVLHHGLNSGDVVTVFFSCLTASGLLQQLVGHLIEWNKGKASSERLIAVLEFENPEQLLCDSIGLMPGNAGAATEKLESLGWDLESSSKYDDSHSAGLNSKRLKSVDSCLSFGSSSSFSSYPCKKSMRAAGHAVFSDVVFSYPARPEIVLAGLSLDFPPGSLTFVLGTSGSGKSTIAMLLSKQYPWQAGEVKIDGHGVDLLSKNWIERNVYVVEQMPKLFDVSLLDNIRIGARSPQSILDDQIEEACWTACAEFISDLPMGLETPGSYPLSGGQVQRISLCRALMSDAPIMVLDEATSALNPELQCEVMNRLTARRKDKTTIVVTHDHSIIPEGHPVYVMDDGIARKFDTISTIPPIMSGSQSLPSCYKEDSAGHIRPEPIAPELAVKCGVNVPKKLNGTTLAKNTSLALLKSIPNKWLFFLGLLITAVHAAINPIYSFVFSKLIMGVLDSANSHVTLWAMLVLMCAILDGVVTLLSVVLNVVAEKWLTSVRERLFSQLLDFQPLVVSREKSAFYSKLLISDAEKCAGIITLYWPGLLNMFVLGLFGIIWSLVTGWKLTLVGFSLIPIFFAVNQLYKWMSTRWTARRELLRGNVTRLLSDLMTPSGFRTLKLQHLEHFFQVIYDKRENDVQALTGRMALEIGFGYGALKSFPYILESLVLWYGMFLTAKNYYAPQTTMTVFSLIMFTIITIDQLTSRVASVGTGFEASERLMQALADTESASAKRLESKSSFIISDGKSPEFELISFHRVEVRTRSGHMILHPFRAEFKKGEVVAIVGSSGLGKSTIARLFLKLLKPSRGEIVIDQKWDLESISSFNVRQSIAMVGQAPLDFFEGTLEENLLYALDPNDISGPAKLLDICRLCGVHDFVRELQDGYNTRMKEGLLSGGQMQRLGIARAVLRMPKVLILDECTSALDQQSKHLIFELVNNLRATRDMLIIMITHQMDMVSVADRTITLDA